MLGHVASKDGMEPVPGHCKAMRNSQFRILTQINDLQANRVANAFYYGIEAKLVQHRQGLGIEVKANTVRQGVDRLHFPKCQM